ncbi:uncharacterized protein LOC129753624 [Uranotaenia lowii]|uniref:uncharacterized protein LOC129753624 n=1 Tax=Uranotaenia lowii TaxID=190385 RepID=UPI002478B668|nr:uncharacterized protein LOC129753624 [Uranotaenia lowii]
MSSGRKTRHDNGAVDDAPIRKKKKSSKLESVEKELEQIRSINKELVIELEKARESIRALQTSLKPVRDNDERDFSDGCIASSTQHPPTNADESRFLSSMNQISITSLAIGECKPSIEGEEITRQDFEIWKELLIDSLNLAGVTDEATKFTVFRVKAGPRLLNILRNTQCDTNSPDKTIYPFSNAIDTIHYNRQKCV